MAEEVVKYKIEIDQESLAAELAAVREQMNLSMGSAAYNNDITPSAVSYAAQNPVLTLPPMQMEQMAPVNVQEIAPYPTGGGQSLYQMFDNAAENTKLGFQKFSEDIRRMGLFANSDPYLSQDTAALHMVGPEGFWQSAGASIMPELLGNYDRDFSGMFRADYKRKAIENVLDGLNPLKMSMPGTLTGLAIGAQLGGFGGALVGLGVGSFVDLAKDLAFGPTIQQDSIAKGFKAIAEQNFGNITKEEANKMANILLDKTESRSGKRLDYDLEILQKVQTTFANAGGFANATSAEEMEMLVKQTTDQYRRVGVAMKLALDESVTFMADLQKNMIVGAEDMASMSEKISQISKNSGVSTMGVHQLGMTGVNMLRGSGVRQSEAYEMSLDALQQVERIRKGSISGEQLVSQMGGVENAALAQVEAANRFMLSGQGMLLTASYLGGNNMTGNMGDTLTSAGEFIAADPKRFLQMSANMGKLTGMMGLESMQASSVVSAMQKLSNTNFANEDGTIDFDVLTGFMMKEQNISAETAKAMIMGFQDAAKQDPKKREIQNLMRSMEAVKADNDAGLWSKITGDLAYGFSTKKWRRDTFGEPYEDAEGAIEEAGEWWDAVVSGVTTIDKLKMNSRDRKALKEYKDSEEYKEIYEKNLRVLDHDIYKTDQGSINLLKETYGKGVANSYEKFIKSSGLGLDTKLSKNIQNAENYVTEKTFSDQELWEETRSISQKDLLNPENNFEKILELAGFKTDVDPEDVRGRAQNQKILKSVQYRLNKEGKGKAFEEMTKREDYKSMLGDKEALATQMANAELAKRKEKSVDEALVYINSGGESAIETAAISELDAKRFREKMQDPNFKKAVANFLASGEVDISKMERRIDNMQTKADVAEIGHLIYQQASPYDKNTLTEIKDKYQISKAANNAWQIGRQATLLASSDKNSLVSFEERREFFEDMITSNNLAGKDSQARVGDKWNTPIVNKAIDDAGFRQEYADLKAQFKDQTPDAITLYSAASKIKGANGESLDKVLKEQGVIPEMMGRKPLSDTTILNKLNLALDGDAMRVTIVDQWHSSSRTKKLFAN